MLNFRSVVFKAPNYINRFGLFHGLRLLVSVERDLKRFSTRIDAINVPGLQVPVHLRATRSDHATFWQCLVLSQYDLDRFPQAQRLNQAYEHMLARGEQPLIIDCGANIGLAALWLANRFPKARIIAVEPDQDNFKMLGKNLAHLSDRVQLIWGGIWNEEGNLIITNPNAGAAAYRVTLVPEASEKSIRAYTIPELCQQAGVKHPFITKIDIEGAQKSLFSSNTEWVDGTHLVMLELDDWQMPWSGSSRPFFSTISRAPFDYLIRGESIFCFRDFG